jgi:hypothetical protein
MRAPVTNTLTGIAHRGALGVAVAPAADVHPLRSLHEWARSIFDAARELVEDSADLVES